VKLNKTVARQGFLRKSSYAPPLPINFVQLITFNINNQDGDEVEPK